MQHERISSYDEFVKFHLFLLSNCFAGVILQSVVLICLKTHYKANVKNQL